MERGADAGWPLRCVASESVREQEGHEEGLRMLMLAPVAVQPRV